MRRLITLVLLAAAGVCSGQEHAVIRPAHNSLSDLASLQRGARLFVNYCVSCHSASFMRYNRIAEDLKLSETLVEDNLMFTTDRLGDTMQVAMQPEDAADWFGVAAADLSVLARARGTDWLFSYLTSFYADPSRPTGVNNRVFRDTAMPHVLWELQGIQEAVTRTETNEQGDEVEVFERFELSVPGLLSEREYERAVRDIVNFLEYLGEPAKLKRYKLGTGVIVYLIVLLAVAYLLKREYWRHVH
jgi:ubiquinol-cytochrome c reductase cytochrome c1 subunit